MYGFKAGEYSHARGKVELFADLVLMGERAVRDRDDPLLEKIADYVSWASAQKSDDLASALDLAFFLPAFRSSSLCQPLRDCLPKELFDAKWAILMEDHA